MLDANSSDVSWWDGDVQMRLFTNVCVPIRAQLT